MENLIYLPTIAFRGYFEKEALLKWKVNNYSFVKKGDLLAEFSIPSISRKCSVYSSHDGMVVKIVRESTAISKYKPSYIKVAICGIYDSYEDYIYSFYMNKAIVTLDSFTNQKTINWEFVAKPKTEILYSKNYNDINSIKNSQESASQNTSKLLLSTYPSPSIYFSLIYEEGISMIVFTYKPKEVKIKKNDTISFLFKNGSTIDLKILTKPYKIAETAEEMHVKCQLYLEDINLLMNEKICKWRLSFNESGKPAITSEINGAIALYSEERNGREREYKDMTKARPYLIQKYVRDYVSVLQQECPNYEHPRKTRPFETTGNYSEMFDWCYVYLMKDLSNGYYKIGISNKPEYREHTLQSEKPTIEMIRCKKYPSRKIAEAFEKALHQAFSERHIRGEWFSLNEYEVATLLETLKE